MLTQSSGAHQSSTYAGLVVFKERLAREQTEEQASDEESHSAAALTNQKASAPKGGTTFDSPSQAKDTLKGERKGSPKPAKRVHFDIQGEAPRPGYLPPPDAPPGEREVAIHMRRVCFHHAYGRPCERLDKGTSRSSHDPQEISFGYTTSKQPDQPEPKGKAESPRVRLIGMQVEDLFGLMNRVREDRRFGHTMH